MRLIDVEPTIRDILMAMTVKMHAVISVDYLFEGCINPSDFKFVSCDFLSYLDMQRKDIDHMIPGDYLGCLDYKDLAIDALELLIGDRRIPCDSEKPEKILELLESFFLPKMESAIKLYEDKMIISNDTITIDKKEVMTLRNRLNHISEIFVPKDLHRTEERAYRLINNFLSEQYNPFKTDRSG